MMSISLFDSTAMGKIFEIVIRSSPVVSAAFTLIKEDSISIISLK